MTEMCLMTHLLPWMFTIISIAGAVLNVRKRRVSFLLYTVANIGWIFINLFHGIYAQAALFGVFTGLSVWGWIEWGRK